MEGGEHNGGLKFLNLECNLDAELQHIPVLDGLTMDELVQEETPLLEGATCQSVEC